MKKAFTRVKAACPFPPPGPIASTMPTKNDDRARRLAEALRENLKRRKAQARGGDSDEEATPSPESSAPLRPQS
jgi:hypothetical protein